MDTDKKTLELPATTETTSKSEAPGKLYQGQGDLSVVVPTGGHQQTTTTSYIEFNDGKVCWYYPRFPEVSRAYSTSDRDSPRHSEVDYYYEEEDGMSISNAANGYGDYPWAENYGNDGRVNPDGSVPGEVVADRNSTMYYKY